MIESDIEDIPLKDLISKKSPRMISKKTGPKTDDESLSDIEDIPLKDLIPKKSPRGISKIVRPKYYFDRDDVSIFTTQKLKSLEYGAEKGIPSKYVIPIYKTGEEKSKIKNTNIPEDYITLYELLTVKLDENIPIVSSEGSSIVESVREMNPLISEREILYFISDILGNNVDKDFFRQAELVSTKYRDPETFQNEKYNFQTIDIPNLLKKDKKELKTLNNLFKTISKIDPITTSDMTITKMTLEFDVSFDDEGVASSLLDEAPDIFANIQLNDSVPFVQYNDSSTSKYKAFNGETFETRPPFKLFEYRFNKFEDRNMFYFIVFADKYMKDFTKASYIPAVIDLDNLTLSFKYQLLVHRSEQEILDSLKNVFQSISFKNRREKNYGATFNLYEIDIREDSFLDLILTGIEGNQDLQSLAGSLLFVDEFTKPVSEKKKLKVYYDTELSFDRSQESSEMKKPQDALSKMASLGFTMTRYTAGLNDSLKTSGRYTLSNFPDSMAAEKKDLSRKNTPFVSRLIDRGTSYISVDISKAANKFVLFQFMNIFSRIITVYKQIKDDYEKIYDTLIPQLNNKKVQEESMTLIPYPEVKEIEKVGITAIAPEIFTSSYSRDCQFKTQPIIIEDKEAEYWKNQKIKYRAKMVERPVLKLGDYNFVCPGDEYPFVAFKQNLDEDRKYPYYPCCYTKPQKEIKKREKGTIFRSKEPIKTNKVLALGGLGILPSSIFDLIKGGLPDRTIKLFRMGTFISPNSFIACVLIALNDKKFLVLDTQEKKEKYISNIKKRIVQVSNFSVSSSELFDLSEEERKEMFLNNDDFLDPALFYRVLEEIFGLNIFIFSASLPKPNVETVYNLEISRFSSIPIHSLNKDKPTLVIYKHWGSETDHLPYPQCELIVGGIETQEILLYQYELSVYMLKCYLTSTEIFGKMFLPNRPDFFQNYSSLTVYNLLKSNFVGELVDTIATGQIIDEKGKLAGLQIQIETGEKITIGLPPLVPQGLPAVEKISKPKLKTVLKFLEKDPVMVRFSNNKPTGVSYEKDNAVAIWFELPGMKFGIQIPIEPVSRQEIEKRYKLIQTVPETRLVLSNTDNTNQSQIKRLFKIQKDTNIIVQIVRWLFLILIRREERSTNNVLSIEEKLSKTEDFFESYIKLNPRKEDFDSSKVYDFTNMPRKLPNIDKSIIKILKELESYAPTFVKKQKLIISGRDFYEKIKESLEYFIRMNALPSNYIPEYLDEYYQSIYDYPKIPKNIIFLNKIDFERWLKQARENPTSSYPVYYSLKGKIHELNTPFLFVSVTGSPSIKDPFGEKFLFLIQNAPFVNSKQAAIDNAISWRDNTLNHQSIKTELNERGTSSSNYKVFIIGQNEKFQLLEDKSDPRKKYETVFILKYTNIDRYASVLPLITLPKEDL